MLPFVSCLQVLVVVNGSVDEERSCNFHQLCKSLPPLLIPPVLSLSQAMFLASAQRCSVKTPFAMLTADIGANSTITADREQSMGSEGTDMQQTDAVIQQEVRTSAAALQAATAAPQTPLELAASVATAVPGPHHCPSPAQDQASAGGPYAHLQSMSNVICQFGHLDVGTEAFQTHTQATFHHAITPLSCLRLSCCVHATVHEVALCFFQMAQICSQIPDRGHNRRTNLAQSEQTLV